jgi:hypothetical protein
MVGDRVPYNIYIDLESESIDSSGRTTGSAELGTSEVDGSHHLLGEAVVHHFSRSV